MTWNQNQKTWQTKEFGIQPVSFLKPATLAVEHDNQTWYVSMGHLLAC